MQKNISQKKGGYTIIETMIAVSLFSVIILTGMNTLLNASLLQNKSEDMRSVMDNLNFIMEEMSRNLRTGSGYHCINNGSTVFDCELGEGVSFTAALGGTWIYRIHSDGSLRKTINGSETILTSPEIVIDSSSGFSVLGAAPAPGDEGQPLVRMRLKGEITSKNTVTPFSLQTTVSQRTVDIP